MKIGIFAKTFSRPTIEYLFQAIGGYEIYSAQFNLSCAGSTLCRKTCHPTWFSG
jgi:hypothetical protein